MWKYFRCTVPALWLRHPGLIATPPIFKAGWILLTDASYEDSGLIPDGLRKTHPRHRQLGPVPRLGR